MIFSFVRALVSKRRFFTPLYFLRSSFVRCDFQSDPLGFFHSLFAKRIPTPRNQRNRFPLVFLHQNFSSPRNFSNAR